LGRDVKITVAVSVFFLLILAYVGVQYVLIYDALYEVNIEIEKLVVDELSDSKAMVSVTMNLFNPGLVDVRITRFQWEIYLNGQLVGSSDLHPYKLISPTETYIVTRKIDMTYYSQTLFRAQSQKEWAWRIVGSAKFETPLLKMEMPFDKELIFSE
jgi:hypothetical protein